VLGICLGAQLLAKALGAPVYRNAVKEIGWFPIHWSPDAARDRLFHGLNDPEIVFHWHGETFDRARDATWLASSKDCMNQAFRYGNGAYGLQFHIEATPSMIEDWLRQDANAGDTRELDHTVEPHAYAARQKELSETIFGRWADGWAPK
jgi:GMP synthase-like glutamine amidotransferase